MCSDNDTRHANLRGIDTMDDTRPELTSRQRVVVHLAGSLANDMDRGTREEQATAALLRLVADAVTHGYAGELVVVGRAWAVEREAATGVKTLGVRES